ncbi:MAG: hypothetical protein HG454_002600 [Clostridiales bacterium]|nr:hypothetical protein [Clostridiales bacterium]
MEENENKKGKENKNENKEETIVANNANKKKYIIPILIIVIIILIGGICYLHMNIVSKDKNIADKEKIIKQQKEELLNISKDKENEKKKEKEKQTTKPNEQQKETKYLSKEEYLKIFKKFVGTDFPGDYSKENEYNKKIEILEDVTEGFFDKCKYLLKKSSFPQQQSSGVAEGDYKVITRQQVRDIAHQFVRDMGYGKITEYRDNYDKTQDGIKTGKPYDLRVDLIAHNRQEKELKLSIIFLRDKDNKVTNKVYAAYVGIK